MREGGQQIGGEAAEEADDWGFDDELKYMD